MTQDVENSQDAVKEGRDTLLTVARRVLLAGVGAVALAQEEFEEFVDRLVERGEIAEKDGKALVRDWMEQRRRRTEQTEEEVDRRITELLQRMNVPTREDMEALSLKIAELTQKVEQLKKE